MVKYVCTEFWSSVYHKQVDTLKTNYQDVYVLTVNDFQPLLKFESVPESMSEIPKVSLCTSLLCFQYLAFPSGLLKGALCSLGLNCIVTAECEQLPTCKYSYDDITNIKIGKFTVTILSYRGVN
ncbi:Trafficking protein particle complex subunit 6b [Schistosoma japonicum]|nr:Trafficking protein particle complex subunit 6b [Schistosoma japonicum]